MKPGFSWTKGHMEIKPLHPHAAEQVASGIAAPFYLSGTDSKRVPVFWTCWVQGGPLFHWRNFFGFEGYIGFRPTAPDPPGVTIEMWPGWFARWLKRHGAGNFGAAFRRKRGGD